MFGETTYLLAAFEVSLLLSVLYTRQDLCAGLSARRLPHLLLVPRKLIHRHAEVVSDKHRQLKGAL